MPIRIVNTRNVPKTAYAPGIRVSADMGFLFLSGITARPLDLDPHAAYSFPEDIGTQTRMMLENIQAILKEAGVTWRDVIKITKFYTEPGGGEVAQEFLHDWIPCATALGVDRLPFPGAKIMYDIIAVAAEK